MSKEGRPTLYDDDVAEKIFVRMISGESINKICGDDSMPDKSTFFRWISKHPEFRDKYELAASERSDALVEDMLDIADNQVDQPLIVDGLPLEIDGKVVMVKDNVSVQHAKLRVDTRKWAASKLKPKKYGDRVETVHSGALGLTDLTEDELDRKLSELQSKLDQSTKD